MSEPGDLRHRLVLEAPVETPDGAGGVVRSYEAAATLWASLDAVSAREAVDAAQLGATITHRILIRKGPELTARHRFRAGGRIFRIVSFRDREESGRFIEIAAEERAD